MERPELLDNQDSDTRHGVALEYLFGDIPGHHAFAAATGYVNLGGLHHLATLADGRPLRLLLGLRPTLGWERICRRLTASSVS